MNNKKAFTPDPGVGYVKTYTDRKTGEDVSFIAITTKEDIAAGTKLVLFRNDNKKSEKHPDYVLKLSKDQGEGRVSNAPAPQAQVTAPVAAPKKKSALPF